MAGKLTISTLNDSSGALATQNGMTGIAKAWVNYNAVAQTVTGSFNVSSITYITVGYYQVNLTTAMADANYAVSGSASGTASQNAWFQQYYAFTNTTTAFRIVIISSVVGGLDTTKVNAVVYGN